MSDQLTSLLTQFHLTQDNLEIPCSDNLFLTLSQEIPSFEVAAPYFGFTLSVIEEIRQDHDNERSKKLHMLWNWKRRNGSDATYLAIVTIFLQMKDRVLAELVLKTPCCEIMPIAIDSHVNPGRVSRYGNWEALNEVEKEQIKNTLISENEIVRAKFAFLSEEILSSFEKRAIPVDHLKLFIVNYMYDVPLSGIQSATTLAAVMMILSRSYISWFNITLFKRCVMRFGSNDDQEKMRVYETEHLAPYLQRSIFEIPSKSFSHGNADLASLYVFIPEDIVLTGKDVVKIGSNLCKILDIKDGIIQCIGYEPGSTILIFGMPQALIRIPSSQTLERHFTFDLDKKACTLKNDFLDQILPPEIKEPLFDIKSKEEMLFDIKRLPIIKRHPNGTRVAETIDRTNSGLLASSGHIAAIDFGTANCSIAFCNTEDEEMTLVKLSDQVGQVRVPTILLMNEKGEPILFGNRAIRQYQRLDPSQRLKHHLFERIKLALGPHEDISRDTKIPDINGKMFFLRDVIALFIKYLKDELERLFQMLNINLTATDFHWVITVPAIWSASGKQMMREAAYQAGLCGTHNIEKIAVVTHKQPLEVKCPERLSLALEPEAAAFHCRTMQQKDIVEFCSPQAGNPKTNKFIVVDIGAGTTDISAHGITKEGNIEVLTSPEGNLAGGNAVNQEFEQFLSQLVDDPGFSTYLSSLENKVCLRSIVYDEFEEEKKEFGYTYISKYANTSSHNLDSSEHVFQIKLDEVFYEFYKQKLKDALLRLCIKEDWRVSLGRHRMLRIHYSKMEEFFDGPVSKTLASLQNILKQVESDIDTIYLVGGFGGCQYMYYRMQKALNPRDSNRFKIVIPKSPHLAVVKGALRYRNNPEIITSRVAEATYGTETTLTFNEEIHRVEYRDSTKNGREICRHLFSPIVIKGERVYYNQVKQNIYQPLEPSQTAVKFNLIMSRYSDLFYTRSPNKDLKEGVKVLATITVPSPNTELGTDRDIYLTFDFSNTEIQVHAYDATSNNECRAIIDYLTTVD